MDEVQWALLSDVGAGPDLLPRAGVRLWSTSRSVRLDKLQLIIRCRLRLQPLT